MQSKDAYDTPQKARETKNQPAKYLRARALTDFCVAKSLALGLGWIFFTESALEIARSFVIAAKILLAGTKDRIITGYVNVIYAGIQRSEHADDEQALGEAIKELQNSYNLFSKNDEHEMHAAYKMRAALELALAHLQGFQCGGLPDLNALNVAEDFAKEGESLAGSDERWMCNSLVLQSRIHRLRGRADLALDAARVALEKGNKEVFLRIDAWIAQGEARAASSPPDHRGAIDDFSKALDQGRQNPKVSAVCHLHLAKMYLALGDVRSAVAHFGDSEKASEFRNAFIRTLRSKVKAAITKSREEFKIHIEDKVTDATELEKDFHGFLTEWARKHSKNDQEAAGLLRINIKTFYDWRAKAGLSKKVDQDNPD